MAHTKLTERCSNVEKFLENWEIADNLSAGKYFQAEAITTQFRFCPLIFAKQGKTWSTRF